VFLVSNTLQVCHSVFCETKVREQSTTMASFCAPEIHTLRGKKAWRITYLIKNNAIKIFYIKIKFMPI